MLQGDLGLADLAAPLAAVEQRQVDPDSYPPLIASQVAADVAQLVATAEQANIGIERSGYPIAAFGVLQIELADFLGDFGLLHVGALAESHFESPSRVDPVLLEDDLSHHVERGIHVGAQQFAQLVAAAFDLRLGAGEAGFGIEHLDAQSQGFDLGDEADLEFALGQVQVGARLFQALGLDFDLADALHQVVVRVDHLSFEAQLLEIVAVLCVGQVEFGPFEGNLLARGMEQVVGVEHAHVAVDVQVVGAGGGGKIPALGIGDDRHATQVRQALRHGEAAVVDEVGGLFLDAGLQGHALLHVADFAVAGQVEIGLHLQAEWGPGPLQAGLAVDQALVVAQVLQVVAHGQADALLEGQERVLGKGRGEAGEQEADGEEAAQGARGSIHIGFSCRACLFRGFLVILECPRQRQWLSAAELYSIMSIRNFK